MALARLDEIIFAIALRLKVSVSDVLEWSTDELEIYYRGLVAEDRREMDRKK